MLPSLLGKEFSFEKREEGRRIREEKVGAAMISLKQRHGSSTLRKRRRNTCEILRFPGYVALKAKLSDRNVADIEASTAIRVLGLDDGNCVKNNIYILI